MKIILGWILGMISSQEERSGIGTGGGVPETWRCGTWGCGHGCDRVSCVGPGDLRGLSHP